MVLQLTAIQPRKYHLLFSGEVERYYNEIAETICDDELMEKFSQGETLSTISKGLRIGVRMAIIRPVYCVNCRKPNGGY